jgi:hypothetical protein
LAWYDEPIADLERCVASCAGVVDHLIAVDGPYETFPHASTHSPSNQVEAIQSAAMDAGMRCTILSPGIAWRHEGYKRTAMFDLAAQHGTMGRDWLLPIDADEELANTGDLRAFLDAEQIGVTSASFWYHIQPRTDLTDIEIEALEAGTELRSYEQTRLLRLMPDLRVVQPTHSVFASCEGIIGEPDHSFESGSFHILHHTLHRSLERMQAKVEHVTTRNARGEM